MSWFSVGVTPPWTVLRAAIRYGGREVTCLYRREESVVIAALGFEPLDCPQAGNLAELARNEWGGLAVDGNEMSSIPGVFAGGDLVHGPGPLLHAVRDARRAALQIYNYLSVTPVPSPSGAGL